MREQIVEEPRELTPQNMRAFNRNVNDLIRRECQRGLGWMFLLGMMFTACVDAALWELRIGNGVDYVGIALAALVAVVAIGEYRRAGKLLNFEIRVDGGCHDRQA